MKIGDELIISQLYKRLLKPTIGVLRETLVRFLREKKANRSVVKGETVTDYFRNTKS